MPLPHSSIVRLLTNRYQDSGVGPDTIGVIIDAHGTETYEVEFPHSEDNRVPQLLTVSQAEVELVAKPGQLRTDTLPT
jgi:hypothetical protein